jgi:hypothetical protein
MALRESLALRESPIYIYISNTHKNRMADSTDWIGVCPTTTEPSQESRRNQTPETSAKPGSKSSVSESQTTSSSTPTRGFSTPTAGFDTSDAWHRLLDQGIVSETVWVDCAADQVDDIMAGGFVLTNENGWRFLLCQIDRTERFIQEKLGVYQAAVCADHLRNGFRLRHIGYSGVSCAWSQTPQGSTMLRLHWMFTPREPPYNTESHTFRV